tara:strand:+ start:183 stop:407 length:225 start_codon:yes stop_codon:yes gene_type:complete
MKKILLIIFIYFVSFNFSYSGEIKCQNIKKLSKEYINCKTKNFNENANKNVSKVKDGITNFGKKLKKKIKNFSN